MSISLGTSNTTRYYTTPDSPRLILPDSDWFFAAIFKPTTDWANRYMFSTGTFGSANSYHAYLVSTTPKAVRFKYGSVTNSAEVQLPGGTSETAWRMMYATRDGGNIYVGTGEMGKRSTFAEGSGLAVTGQQNSTDTHYLGTRADLESTRFFIGHISQIVFIPGVSLFLEIGRMICDGLPFENLPYYDRATLHIKAAYAKTQLIDQTKRHAFTRNGTGWGGDQSDSAQKGLIKEPITPLIIPAAAGGSALPVFHNQYINQGIV